MIKRMLICVLAVMMLLTSAVAMAEEPAADAAAKEVVVGATTQMDGYFFTDLWSANTADIDVRTLLHGYSTVAIGQSGTYQLDQTVISHAELTEDGSGNKTYVFSINPDLTFSDGSPLTAQDYVFSALLLSSPIMRELGATQGGLPQIEGYDEYAAGEAEIFSGVHLLNEGMFSLTIRAEYLPYFYELMYVNVTPYPMAVLAPDFAVQDDGEGAYITYVGELAEGEEAPGLADVLRETILGDGDGYLYNPTVTSGPYRLTGYDAEAHSATFEKNEYYLGNYEGVVPQIDRITFVNVTNAEMLDKLTSGEIDIANKVTDGDVIDACLEVVNAEDGGLRSSSYLRSGYGFIAFACEDDVTGLLNVRQAVALLTDADAYVEDFLKSYGLRTYGHYGLGQWMATNPDATEALEALPAYDLNPEEAVALLEADGWTLDENGEAFDAGEDVVRYKEMEDGTLLKLELTWAALADNTGCAKLQAYTVENLEAAGFSVVVDEMSFAEMMDIYYRRVERTHNMFYLATNFDLVYDPYYSFNGDEEYQGVRNTTGIDDEELLALADDLRRTEVGANDEYVAKWIALQQRYADILPTYPLYSNVYFDVYDAWVYNYSPNMYHTWASAIVYADLVDPAEQVVEEAATEDVEGDADTSETVEIIG